MPKNRSSWGGVDEFSNERKNKEKPFHLTRGPIEAA